ncbi:hypothetical protein [Solimicrobium silvestre]|uniref:hypothetical protein n=1 Tax=Solimicrobium silvestre TaxID=2099400 RepID=UPI0013FDF498|nr:hypothetical protein [Solimicrobium silvestre]
MTFVKKPRPHKVFGKLAPTAIKLKHVYSHSSICADAGAFAEANKEVTLLFAVL